MRYLFYTASAAAGMAILAVLEGCSLSSSGNHLAVTFPQGNATQVDRDLTARSSQKPGDPLARWLVPGRSSAKAPTPYPSSTSSPSNDDDGDVPPTSFAGFGCFGVIVSGTDNWPAACYADGVTPSGTVYGFQPVSGGEVDLTLPTAQYVVSVFASVQRPGSNLPCPDANALGADLAPGSTVDVGTKYGIEQPFFIGSTVVNLTSDQLVTITNVYDPTHPVPYFNGSGCGGNNGSNETIQVPLANMFTGSVLGPTGGGNPPGTQLPLPIPTIGAGDLPAELQGAATVSNAVVTGINNTSNTTATATSVTSVEGQAAVIELQFDTSRLPSGSPALSAFTQGNLHMTLSGGQDPTNSNCTDPTDYNPEFGIYNQSVQDWMYGNWSAPATPGAMSEVSLEVAAGICPDGSTACLPGDIVTGPSGTLIVVDVASNYVAFNSCGSSLTIAEADFSVEEAATGPTGSGLLVMTPVGGYGSTISAPAGTCVGPFEVIDGGGGTPTINLSGGNFYNEPTCTSTFISSVSLSPTAQGSSQAYFFIETPSSGSVTANLSANGGSGTSVTLNIESTPPAPSSLFLEGGATLIPIGTGAGSCALRVGADRYQQQRRAKQYGFAHLL